MARKKIVRKPIIIPKHKIPPPKNELPLYKYVEDRAKVVANEIYELVDSSEHDKGGIIFIEGPLHSGKTLVAINLAKHSPKKYRTVFAQPKVDRSDVVDGYFYSKRGIKVPVKTFQSRKELADLLDQANVAVIDEVMFIPYEMQSHFLYEIEEFVVRGGWFIGIGLLYTGTGEKFLISAILKERATRVYSMSATCAKCGSRNAVIGQRLVDGKPASTEDPELVPPSDTVTYEPRCWDCFVVFD